MTDENLGMDIEAFVSETLVQIVKGVASAQKQISEDHPTAAINPDHEGARFGEVRDVELDVAVTVTEQAAHEGEAGLKITVLKAGGKKGHTSENVAASHVRFAVPLSVPHTPRGKYDEVSMPQFAETDY